VALIGFIMLWDGLADLQSVAAKAAALTGRAL
jgi:hypothetical protein